ncbi:unnamed protein product, partial [marine sediment metagenome]
GLNSPFERFRVLGSEVQGSSPLLAGEVYQPQEGHQFDQKRNFVVSFELHGVGYKVEGAGRMHAI